MKYENISPAGKEFAASPPPCLGRTGSCGAQAWTRCAVLAASSNESSPGHVWDKRFLSFFWEDRLFMVREKKESTPLPCKTLFCLSSSSDPEVDDHWKSKYNNLPLGAMQWISKRGTVNRISGKSWDFVPTAALSLLVRTISQLFTQIPFLTALKSQNGFRGCSEPVQIQIQIQNGFRGCSEPVQINILERDPGAIVGSEEPDFVEEMTVWGCVEGTRKYSVIFLLFRPKKCHIS